MARVLQLEEVFPTFEHVVQPGGDARAVEITARIRLALCDIARPDPVIVTRGLIRVGETPPRIVDGEHGGVLI